MNEEKEMIVIQNKDGSTVEVELITYLISEDNSKTFLVYSKGEKNGADQDEVIYISRIEKSDNNLKLCGIADDNEWVEVQKMLKVIANS